MYKQNLNSKSFISLALIISTCFSSISLFENTDNRNMITYEIGALRDIESRMHEEEIIDHKSNFSYFSLLVGINGKHEIKVKFCSIDNHITGISPYVDGNLFNIGYDYYFVENNVIPLGFNLKFALSNALTPGKVLLEFLISKQYSLFMAKNFLFILFLIFTISIN